MTSTDPFKHSSDAIGEPYANAFDVDVEALQEGDVVLPFTSSAIMVAGSCRLTLTLHGGTTAKFWFNGDRRIYPLRVTRIHQIEPGSVLNPDSIVTLW